MSFVHREGNRASHALSKLATRSVVDQQWLNESPECIDEIILIELVALSL
jgi:hypothetical protein